MIRVEAAAPEYFESVQKIAKAAIKYYDEIRGIPVFVVGAISGMLILGLCQCL